MKPLKAIIAVAGLCALVVFIGLYLERFRPSITTARPDVKVPTTDPGEGKLPEKQEQFQSWLHPSKSAMVEGVGRTVDELKALHAAQDLEFKRTGTTVAWEEKASSPDGVLAEASVAEILALHEAQEKTAKDMQDPDALVPMALDDEGEELTVAELRLLHQEQEALYQAINPYLEEVVAPLIEEYALVGSVGEVNELHEHQKAAEVIDIDAAAP